MTDTAKPTMTELMELRATLAERDREIARLKGETAKISQQLTDATGQLKSAKLHIKIADAARKLGVLPAAITDVVSRAERAGEWDVDPKGNFRRKDEHGFFDEDPYEWLRKIKSDVPFFFEDSALTEGLSGKSASSTSVRKSITVDDVTYSPEQIREIFKPKEQGGNFTKASQIYRKDPELAETVAKEVGNKIFARIEAQDRKFGR